MDSEFPDGCQNALTAKTVCKNGTVGAEIHSLPKNSPRQATAFGHLEDAKKRCPMDEIDDELQIEEPPRYVLWYGEARRAIWLRRFVWRVWRVCLLASFFICLFAVSLLFPSTDGLCLVHLVGGQNTLASWVVKVSRTMSSGSSRRLGERAACDFW